MRAFVALELPAPAQRRLIATQRELVRQLRLQQLDRCVRWTTAANLHLTLRFLGEIDDLQRRALEDALATLAREHSRLLLDAGGLGCFPNTRRPNVIWCGIEGGGAALARLQADVERTARRIGLPAEEKSFAPHLTIGRLQRSTTGSQLQAVGATVLHLAAATVTPAPATTSVGELLLMQSELTPSGPIYTPLGVFSLSASTTPHAP